MSNSCIYASGVVASLYNKLITKDCFLRMIEAPTSKEALSILQETSFGSGVVIDSPFEIEKVLTSETKKLINFVKTESPSYDFTSFFLLPYDYYNISAVCKALILTQSEEAFVQSEGLYTINKIKDIISTKKYEEFNNKFMTSCLQEFFNLASKNIVKGYEVDYLFKKYMYLNLQEIAKKNKILNTILKLNLDIENISVAMRSSTQFVFESQKVINGYLSDEELVKIFKKDRSVLNSIKNDQIKKFVTLALSENKDNSFVDFEIYKNKFLFPILTPHKYDNETIMPFMLYCYTCQAQIKNVRLIMSYKNNNLSDKIKKRFLECK